MSGWRRVPYTDSDREMGLGETYELRAPSATPLYGEADAHLVDWRLYVFLGYGFDTTDAGLLAQRRDVDRVVVERLLKAGATHEQVRDLVL